ncbi:MAG: hypothetical protein FWD83_06300 [Promicromonosporaceae bacterium]|nr:hypothetical protein [Promicromonosporaceae bacterium]
MTPTPLEPTTAEPTPVEPTPKIGNACEPDGAGLVGTWLPVDGPDQPVLTFLADGSGFTPAFESRVESFRERREQSSEDAQLQILTNPFYRDVADYLDGLADWPNDPFLWRTPEDSVLVIYLTSITLTPWPLPNLYAVEGNYLRLLSLCDDGDYYEPCPEAETRFYRRVLPEGCGAADDNSLVGSWDWVNPPLPGPTFVADGTGCWPAFDNEIDQFRELLERNPDRAYELAACEQFAANVLAYIRSEGEWPCDEFVWEAHHGRLTVDHSDPPIPGCELKPKSQPTRVFDYAIDGGELILTTPCEGDDPCFFTRLRRIG